MSEAHGFDRRKTDVNVAALATRVGILEKGFEVLQHEVGSNSRAIEKQTHEIHANTALTEEAHGQTAELHERVIGTEAQPGALAKVDEMYEIFDSTRNGFRMIGTIGNFGLRTIELGGKVARPLMWMVGLGVALIAFAKTGVWKWP